MGSGQPFRSSCFCRVWDILLLQAWEGSWVFNSCKRFLPAAAAELQRRTGARECHHIQTSCIRVGLTACNHHYLCRLKTVIVWDERLWRFPFCNDFNCLVLDTSVAGEDANGPGASEHAVMNWTKRGFSTFPGSSDPVSILPLNQLNISTTSNGAGRVDGPEPIQTGLEAILNILGEIWKTTCISIVGRPNGRC